MKFKGSLFFKDHIWVIVFYFTEFFILFFGIKYLSSNNSNSLYFGFLGFFLLLCFLAVRYYKTKEFYHALEEQDSDYENLILTDPKSALEQAYHDFMKKNRTSYHNNLNRLKLERKQFEVMSNRWVHQMKTPLSVIRLITENHKLEEDYQKINYEMERLNHHLIQLLNIYKVQSIEHDFKVEKVFLKDIAKHTVNDLKSLFLQKSIYPKIKIDDSLSVYTDVKWLQFILYQLLNNAIKYSDDEGSITIQTEQVDDTINLSIIDTGCGIIKEDLSRIYDLFFTGSNGKSKGESTGMGLYMVKQVLDYLDHKINVSSEEGKGSKFTITFLKR